VNRREYGFSQEKIRLNSIVIVTSDTSRRFSILFGSNLKIDGTVAVHLDFLALTGRQCNIDAENHGKDDFELWSPSEKRPEQCLFGRQTLYHRRVRDTNCVVGDKPKAKDKVVRKCPCTKADFECEFNYVKNTNDGCVLVLGTSSLPDDKICKSQIDPIVESLSLSQRPGFSSKGFLFWFFILLLLFGFTGLVAYYYYFRWSGIDSTTRRSQQSSESVLHLYINKYIRQDLYMPRSATAL